MSLKEQFDSQSMDISDALEAAEAVVTALQDLRTELSSDQWELLVEPNPHIDALVCSTIDLEDAMGMAESDGWLVNALHSQVECLAQLLPLTESGLMVNIMTDIERGVIARQRVDASLFETDRDEWVFQINNIIRVLGIQETLDHDDRFIERSTRTVRLGN